MSHPMLKPVAAFGLAVCVLLTAPLSALAQSAPGSPASPPAATEPDRPPYVSIKGRESTHEDGIIKLTIFLDFFCGHCHKFDTTVVPLLQKEYGDKLQVTYVGMPIVDRQASPIPVIAYYLADAQGKGDVMRDLLFSYIWDLRLDVTKPDYLLAIADKAGLDLEAFKRGFNEGTMLDRLEEGKKTGQAIGLRGTPTLLIDNHLRINDISMRSLEAIFSEVLEGKV